MNKIALGLLMLLTIPCFGQEEKPPKFYSLDASYFYGSIMEHNTDLAHLITGHPSGIILSWNQKTYGYQEWEQYHNYPDFGYSFIYQDMINPNLGDNYGLYGHFNFYFIKRLLNLRIGQGVAFNTNPYHPTENYLNNAYGTRLLSTTYLMGTLKKENIFKGFGIHAGVAIIHYSNADLKSPNNSTNTFTLTAGINYLLDYKNHPEEFIRREKRNYSEPFHYNFSIRGGINSNGVVGSPQLPFLTLSAFADKRLTMTNSLVGGAELFFSRSLEEFIDYKAAAFPQENNSGEEDAKRIGLFIGHRLHFNKISVVTDLGFYAYYPYEDYVNQVYNRLGLQRKITDHFWASATVRSHGANAEAVEFSIGYRL